MLRLAFTCEQPGPPPPSCPPPPPAAVALTLRERRLLKALRRLSLTVPATTRHDPLFLAIRHETCPNAGAEETARALVQLLSVALGRSLIMHRTTSATLSFDECWLMALLRAARREDALSLRIGIATRVPEPLHRLLGATIERLASHPKIDRLLARRA